MKCISLPLKSSCFAACLLLFGGSGVFGAESGNLIVNGDFEAPVPPQGGVPKWNLLGDNTRSTVATEAGNQFLRLNLPSQNYLQVTQVFPVGKDWVGLEISGKARIEGLVKGPEGHNTATLLYTFENAKGEHIGQWNQRFFVDDQDWEPFQASLKEIPEGAVTLIVSCAIMNATGIADFDDIVVTPVTK